MDDNVMELMQKIYGPKPYKTSYKVNFLKMYDLLGSEGSFINVVKEKAYGREYLTIYTSEGELCMADRIDPNDPVSYIDVIMQKNGIYYVMEHTEEATDFKLTEMEFRLVTNA